MFLGCFGRLRPLVCLDDLVLGISLFTWTFYPVFGLSGSDCTGRKIQNIHFFMGPKLYLRVFIKRELMIQTFTDVKRII